MTCAEIGGRSELGRFEAQTILYLLKSIQRMIQEAIYLRRAHIQRSSWQDNGASK